MKKNEQDTYWNNIAYGELIGAEKTGGDCSLIGELVTQQALIDKPTHKQTGKECAYRQHNLSRDEIAEIHEGTSKKTDSIDGAKA